MVNDTTSPILRPVDLSMPSEPHQQGWFKMPAGFIVQLRPDFTFNRCLSSE